MISNFPVTLSELHDKLAESIWSKVWERRWVGLQRQARQSWVFNRHDVFRAEAPLHYEILMYISMRSASTLAALSDLIVLWCVQRKETMDDPYTVVGNMKVATGIMFLSGFAQIAQSGNTLSIPIFAIHGTDDRVTSPKVCDLSGMLICMMQIYQSQIIV